jgi:hypothetical protein
MLSTGDEITQKATIVGNEVIFNIISKNFKMKWYSTIKEFNLRKKELMNYKEIKTEDC